MLKHIKVSKVQTVAVKAVTNSFLTTSIDLINSHDTVLKNDFLIMKGPYLKVKDGLMDLPSLCLNINFKLITLLYSYTLLCASSSHVPTS